MGKTGLWCDKVGDRGRRWLGRKIAVGILLEGKSRLLPRNFGGKPYSNMALSLYSTTRSGRSLLKL